MTAAENPLDVLRRHRPWRADMPKALGQYDAALSAVEQLVEAARALFELAAVAHEGDPWYAEHEGLEGDDILAQARAALARFPVPAQDTGGET